MNSRIILSLLLVAVVAGQLSVRQINPEKSIDNQYIIVFKTSASQDQISSHLSAVSRLFGENDRMIHVYSIGEFQGYAAVLSASALARVLQSSDIVETVEQDAVIHAAQACSEQTNAVWGLDRIDEKEIFLNGDYTYTSVAGAGVDSYIVDTGIRITHQDFGGRAIWGANFVDSNNQDCNGHGTHVAGTVGGTVYGVAKKTTLIAVKVLNCAGSGSYAGVIGGVNWVLSSYNTRKNPSTANMSLGGPISTALDQAVAAAIKGGVTFVVAAGNSNADACTSSPADVATAITVGATGTDTDPSFNQVDNRAYFSNYGKCTSIFAPGLMIQAPWSTSDTATNIISGTSMASPHVCGVTALYLGNNNDASPTDVKNYILAQASNGILELDCNGASNANSCNASPNAFLYSPCS